MVEHAADQRLDGYRELGSRAACAENERDAAIAERERLRNGVGWLVFERTVQTRCGCPQCTMSVGAVADEDGLVGDCVIKRCVEVQS